ncbi:MAG TPA: hypothetical protein VH518_12700 [Tepidisphaeraceae bacterium]|jgi:hypothetical protein
MTISLRFVGIFIGIAAAMLTLETRRRAVLPSPHPVMIPECEGGTIRSLVIHYVRGDTIALPVYRDFLPQLAADVTVHVVCPDVAAFVEMSAIVGPTKCRLAPMTTGHEMTVWSRDRWAALADSNDASKVTLLAPREEDGSEIWPARAGDARVAFDLTQALPSRVTARHTGLFFDAGDLLADEYNVFVTPSFVRKNLQRTVQTRDELQQMLKDLLGRPIVMLDGRSPDHHAGMYMMAKGNHTMLVGDPSLAKALVSPESLSADFSPATQARFDVVAEQLESLGYNVVRIPTVIWPDQKTYFTYVNVIMDSRDGRQIVYMPIYQGAEALNDAAAKVWQNLGYQVRRVDCTSSFHDFGNLHCLVNVLERG